MTAHYLTVTDLELLASQVVKVLAIAILVAAAVINIVKALKGRSKKYQLGRVAISIGLLVVSFMILQWVFIEGSLLNSDQYVIGTTIGMCHVFIRGQGVEFEYEVDGRTYRNCNITHPIPIGEVNTFGGQYYVRYATDYPDCGRIDFERPLRGF